jgi:DNA mismatch endonuclease (patch repair protein)
MAAIRGRDTAPEMLVRRFLHGCGFRYTLHRRDLPGSPDLVFPSRRTVIFVHGCFWHWHGCALSRLPKIRREFWEAKLSANRQRDAAARRGLKRSGWRVLSVWQCELEHRPVEALSALVLALLHSETSTGME